MAVKWLKNNKTLLFSLIILFTGILVYRDCLRTPLFWDDEATILNNVFIRDFQYLPQIFTSGYHHGWGEVTNLYRPLAVVSFLFEYQLWGLNSLGYHLTNVILHTLNSLVLFFLLKKIFRKENFSFLVSFVYLIHPQATETVNYASHRPELLMGLFFMLSLFFYVKFIERRDAKFRVSVETQNFASLQGGLYNVIKMPKTYLILALICYCLSILSKEMGMTVIFFIFLYHLYRREGRGVLQYTSVPL
jgi:hypothetical protein